MSEERKDLAAILWHRKLPYGGLAGLHISLDANAAHAAAELILAAGYQKPRTITTAAQLEALAADSVLLAGSRVYQKDRGALMDLGIGLLGYEEVLDECGRLLCVWEPTA